MLGVIFFICNVAVVRRLGLYSEEDGEEEYYEKEEDGVIDS